MFVTLSFGFERTAFSGIRRGEKSKKEYFSSVPLRVLPPSQKATHGWWERAVKINKSAKIMMYLCITPHLQPRGEQKRG